MIFTLFITIVIEGIIALGYCIWRKKPVISILLTSIGANILTQLLLWGMLTIFFQDYLPVLLFTEMLIWIMETLALYYIPANRLQFAEAMILSLSMNMVSFVLGWFLPL